MALTDYERERQLRIAENKARMAQLGLSQTLTDMRETAVSEKVRARQNRVSRKATEAATSARPLTRRRSERVQGQPAQFYDDAILDRDALLTPGGSRRYRDNHREELYSIHHVRALGTCRTEWPLFVDGYDANGNRVYDKANGKTCHQCRQKTMGKRTECASCSSLNGVFCGDCLYMRYGENVEETLDDPEWICPGCRDLCNCSFHRSRRGWAPTGTLYRRAVAEGYASVAHYLVLNNLEESAKEEALSLMPKELADEVRVEIEEAKKFALKKQEEEQGSGDQAGNGNGDAANAGEAASGLMLPSSVDNSGSDDIVEKENEPADAAPASLRRTRSVSASPVVLGNKKRGREEPSEAADVGGGSQSGLRTPVYG